MIHPLLKNEIFGFVKTEVDVHTLGMTTVTNLLKDCGYKCFISPLEVSVAVENIRKVNNYSCLKQWILDKGISRLGFSYRLDPKEAKDYFCRIFAMLKSDNMLHDNGGPLRDVFFAGLPDACVYVQRELGQHITVFPGDETPSQSLRMLGVPESNLPKDIKDDSEYDKMRFNFAKSLIEHEEYKIRRPNEHLGYEDAGGTKDSFTKRVQYCKNNGSLPLIRAHVGPYNPNRIEAIKEFISWEKELAATRLLDILSIGSSQLTQSMFGENWDGLPNGGGVPVNSEIEYRMIHEAAAPMLVRTYAGTKNILDMAKMHERTLNIAWHALSFWWFCEIDGRGKNTVLENLKEHFETIKYIASTNKPFEPNIPHHFAFRGADDITYIISAYLASKAAKNLGVKDLILQNMLNTPKYTSGIQDLAKSRAMLKLVKELEDPNFRVHLQTRAGLDYFSPDMSKAKIQLAAVTAMMDDIDPNNIYSPEIIHVVSYSEAVRLATPPVIADSIKITLEALYRYRILRRSGKIENMAYNKDLEERTQAMYIEAKESIELLEKEVKNLYTPDGFYKIFQEGFFPVPYLLDPEKKYINATRWNTAIKNGGIRVIDEKGNIIDTRERYKNILS